MYEIVLLKTNMRELTSNFFYRFVISKLRAMLNKLILILFLEKISFNEF